MNFPLLNNHDLATLFQALYFLKVGDLQKVCYSLSLSESGNKNELIERIMTFITTGQIKTKPIIPLQSLAKNYPYQSLSPKSLMLYGGYKNDLATRNFFKKLIGLHFHFTAFGIDWLNDRWLKGHPPTYQEFADYWLEETNRRKKIKAEPKKEWAYISFLQQTSREMPQASREQLMCEWKKVQQQKLKEAQSIIQKLINKVLVF